MPDDKIKDLGDFVKRISALRKSWDIQDDKELWFRGETKEYRPRLRPKLYRPRESDHPIKPVSQLLEIERNLYETFQHGAVQLSNETTEGENWDWDSYFLMQHHSAPTRLLDWSDGALVALHFAVRHKKDDSHDSIVYVLEPYRLKEKLVALPETKITEEKWKDYVKNHPSYGLSDDRWENSYLASDKDQLTEVPTRCSLSFLILRVESLPNVVVLWSLGPTTLGLRRNLSSQTLQLLRSPSTKVRNPISGWS
jgi:FRG domain